MQVDIAGKVYEVKGQGPVHMC